VYLSHTFASLEDNFKRKAQATNFPVNLERLTTMLANQPHPDLLLSSTEPTNFMRLSSKKAARAALFGASNRKSGPPGFPVKFVGVDELYAAFLNDSRTRGRYLGPRTGNPGQAP